jgi:hypothetical protein
MTPVCQFILVERPLPQSMADRPDALCGRLEYQRSDWCAQQGSGMAARDGLFSEARSKPGMYAAERLRKDGMCPKEDAKNDPGLIY